jgi:hypothetical protein
MRICLALPLLAVCGICAFFPPRGTAQVVLTSSTTATLTFTNYPTAAAGWSSVDFGGGTAGDWGDMLQFLGPSAFTAALAQTQEESPLANSMPAWNSALQYVQLVAPVHRAVLLMAALRNGTGMDLRSLSASYSWQALAGLPPPEAASVAVYLHNGVGWSFVPQLSGRATGEITGELSFLWRANAYAHLVWVVPEGQAYALDSFRAHLPAPIVITAQPMSTNRVVGETVSLSVSVLGEEPLQFQWHKDGAPIANATNRSFTIPGVLLRDAGVYAVTASNQHAVVVSSNAVLQVHARPLILNMTNAWRYEPSGTDLGTNWRARDYVATNWASGPGLFGFETTPSIQQLIKTPLPPTTGGTGIITYYFRTEFVFDGDLENAILVASNLIDDGAVFYLNGTEVLRFNMPTGAVRHSTLAAGSAAEGVFQTNAINTAPLLIGTNVLAVEVHQANQGSSDLVFGSALFAFASSGPAVIGRHPQDQVVLAGADATFTASASGQRPIQLQWWREGHPIAGATNQSLTLSNVQVSSIGGFYLTATNALSGAVSSTARLEVVEIHNAALRVVSFTNVWRYRSVTEPLPTNWLHSSFDDSGWGTGRAVFARSSRTFPQPTNTVLTADSPFMASPTFYFRTWFEAPATTNPVTLLVTNLIDDGAVFYVNGTEVARLRMAPGPVTYETTASAAPHNGTQYDGFALPGVLLRPGSNLVAVALHQDFGSSDAVFSSEVRLLASRGEPLRFVVEPSDVEVPADYPAMLSADVFGTGPVTFQWHKNGAPIAGATNATLEIGRATELEEGSYHVVAANAVDSIASRAALLTVNAPANPPVDLTRGPYLQNGVSNAVTIRWRTSDLAESRVWFGTNAGQLTSIASNAQLRTEHELRLTGLLPNTRYYYAVATAFSNLASGADFFFNTPPIAAKSTRVWALGDFGTASANARAVINAFTNFSRGQPADVLLMLGDNAYNSGTQAEYQRALFNFIPDVLRKTLLWSTMGNHETYSPGNPGPFPYIDIFSPPIAGEAGGVPSGTEFYYSFDYGNIHFVCLDSEISSRATNGAMAQWLEQDLAANTKDWLIAFWHSPPYTKGSHNSDSLTDSGGAMNQMRENILPILEAHGVDLVLSGHSHCYERSFLLDGHYGFSHTLQPWMKKDGGDGRTNGTGAYRKTTAGPAPREGAVYIVAGSSGFATFGTMNHPAMAVSYLRMGSLILDIDGHRLDATFLRETGAIDDRFTIIKGAAPEPLRIATFRINDQAIHAAWKSVAGRRYQVEATPSVAESAWTPISPAIEASGATTFWTNSAPVSTSAFLRVRELPAE